MSGQQVKGLDGAVDCIRFGTGCLDDLYGHRRELPQNLPLDACMHAPEETMLALRKLLLVYPEAKQVHRSPDGVYHVEPMDLVVAGPVGGGPGHLIVVGWEPNTCWEANKPCVRKVGVGLDPKIADVKRVYRMSDRHRWLEI